MKKHYQFGTHVPVCSAVLLKLAILIFLVLCTQIISAQSKCVKDDNGILLCDLSISLIEEISKTNPKVVVERAWQLTPTERNHINIQLRNFSETWCETTLGKSRIRNISVLRGHRKSSSDIALYKREGRSYSYVGAFVGLKPSIVAYYGSYYEPEEVDRFLGRVIVHELSHAALKVYDEYREFGATSGEFCGDPLENDNPRQTMMNDHRRYTRYSHPDDYVGIPAPSTAQYRCYGKSAWGVLLQPERCDSNLSLEVNAWFPRQDYFAETETCVPASVPPIDTLLHPNVESAVSECIDMTRSQSNIKFLSGSENIVIAIDSGIGETDKETVGRILRETILLLAQNVDVDDILNENLVIDQAAVEKRIALLDFNQSSTPSLIEVKQNRQALEQRLADILENNPQTRNSINQNLSSVRTIFENDLNRVMNDHNVVIVISDTSTSPSASALNFFKENNIAISVIAVGERFNFGLSQLAAETGGDYHTIIPAQRIEVLIYALVNSAPGGDLFHTTDLSNKTIPLNGTIREIETVPEDTDVITIGVEVEDGRLDDVIVRPSVGPSPVSRIMTSRARFYTISNSTPGRWEVVITGTGTLKYKFSILQGISLEINAGAGVNPRSTQSAGACSGLSDPVQIVMCHYRQECREEISAGIESEECADLSPENMPNPSPMSSDPDINQLISLPVTYPAPVMIRARVHGRLPVLDANVDAEITTPDDGYMPIQLALLDDGQAPDIRARDGIYSGVLKDYSRYGNGIYTIKVTASNLNGRAIFDDTGIATFGGEPSELPRSAPPFEVVGYRQVEVIVPALASADESSARALRTDGALHWGVIGRPGHTDHYNFVADRSGLHYIQTSNLLSYDEDIAMATRVQLYESATEQSDLSYLTENVAYRRTNVSHIAQMLDEGESYTVSVSHANDNGTGVYGLTVSNANNLLSAHELSQEINSGGGSSGGGGGIVGSLMLIFLIIAFIVLHNRRKSHQNA